MTSYDIFGSLTDYTVWTWGTIHRLLSCASYTGAIELAINNNANTKRPNSVTVRAQVGLVPIPCLEKEEEDAFHLCHDTVL